MPQFHTFDPDFIFGVATAAYQIEGAWNQGGRGESIWDRFCHTVGKIKNGDTGDIACDHYNRFAEDVALLKAFGVDAYRFSTSWSRVQPLGSGAFNLVGIDFYERLIDSLLANDIEPFLTLYHWDLPQALQKNGGFAGREAVERFGDYAFKMVERFSDRVRFWTTFNEPWCTSYLGYAVGTFAPGLIDVKKSHQVAHNQLVAHGLAVRAARQAAKRPIDIGIVLNIAPSEPLRPDNEGDVRLAAESWEKDCGVWLEPLYHGLYPEAQLNQIADIREGDLALTSEKTDYLGINFYMRNVQTTLPEWSRTHRVEGSHYTAMDWEVHPASMRLLLNSISDRYSRPPIYITENGAAYDDEPDKNGYVMDAQRRDYLRLHLQECALAKADGVDLRGYFAWSLLDNFEWAEGYSKRFGLVRVDYETQKRTVKMSGEWYADAIKNRRVEKW
jgi:beta-glucosidase